MSVHWTAEPLRALLPAYPYALNGQCSELSDLVARYRQYYQWQIPENIDKTCSLGWCETAVGRVFVQAWMQSQDRPTVIFCHGYFDHSAMNGPFAQWVLRQGYNLVMWDLPGHGLSDGKPADIGSFDDYSAAFASVLSVIPSTFTRSVHLIAHSTGAALLLNGVLRQHKGMNALSDNQLCSVTFLAPLVRPMGYAWIRRLLPLLQGRLDSWPRRFNASTHDKSFLDFQQFKDPLQARQIPLRWIAAMVSYNSALMADTYRDLPLQILQGDADLTVSWRQNMSLLKKMFPLASIHPLAGARHHLLRESSFYQALVEGALRAIWSQAESVFESSSTSKSASTLNQTKP